MLEDAEIVENYAEATRVQKRVFILCNLPKVTGSGEPTPPVNFGYNILKIPYLIKYFFERQNFDFSEWLANKPCQ